MKLAEIPAFALSGAETRPYSLEEIAAMLKVLSEPSATAVATAAFTGLGELRGLTWGSYEPAQDEESLDRFFCYSKYAGRRRLSGATM